MKSSNECIDFICSLTKEIPHGGNISLASHLLGVYSILKKVGAPENVCLAGLFHSIYSTEHFNTPFSIERDTVRDFIGKEAEELVFLFCHLRDRDHTILKTENKDLIYINFANLYEISTQLECEDLKEMIDRYQSHLLTLN